MLQDLPFEHKKIMPINNYPAHRFTIAPMMGYSHKHFIAFMRLISKNWLLFTEMLPANGVVANRQRLCDWRPQDAPLIVQLGGSDGKILGEACQVISDYKGVTGINLNMGCPSPRVQNGAFGACLMLEPEKSADLIAFMAKSTDLPISVKLRIGVNDRDDDQEDEQALHDLIGLLLQAGAKEIYLHARKAILKGLSPKQNRNIPPLRYDVVFRCQQKFPDLTLIVNGGINTMVQAKDYLEDYSGVMIGRMATTNPLSFRHVDSEIFGYEDNALHADELFQYYLEYIHQQLTVLANDKSNQSERYVEKSIYHYMLQPLFTLMYGVRGAKEWRMMVNDVMRQPEKLHDPLLMQKMQEFLKIESLQ